MFSYVHVLTRRGARRARPSGRSSSPSDGSDSVSTASTSAVVRFGRFVRAAIVRTTSTTATESSPIIRLTSASADKATSFRSHFSPTRRPRAEAKFRRASSRIVSLTIGRWSSPFVEALRMKSQTRIGRRCLHRRAGAPLVPRRLGSLVEEPERLGIGCELIEYVSSPFQVGTQVRQGVFASDTSMPALPLRPSMRKRTRVKQPDQGRT